MPRLTFDGETFDRDPTESVLDCLLRHEVAISHACKSGVCQSCLVCSVDQAPPAAAQKDLRASLKEQGYFLACRCIPEGDMVATSDTPALIRLPAEVYSIETLSRRIARLRLRCLGDLDYRPGQFLNLIREDGLTRPYSIASLPQRDDYIELHIQRMAHGRMSRWIHEELRRGDRLEISTALGDCYYPDPDPQQPLLLIGTGSGLAPLYGIARDALNKDHRAPIWLYHGSRDRDGLYLVEELRTLAAEHPQFHYVPCLSGDAASEGFVARRACDAALARHGDLQRWRAFLCGHPEMVQRTRKRIFLAGAAFNDIHTDAFIHATQ